jgi:hypothetical protein
MTRRLSSASLPVPFALAVLAVGLSACGSLSLSENRPRLACPDVVFERSTADLVAFRPGPGRDLTDVMYEAQLTGYTGDCVRAKNDSSVTLILQPTFTVSKGPAWPGGNHKVEYFVAVPAFYPAPQAKQVYGVPFTFTSGTMTSVVLRDEKVTVDVPAVGDATKPPPVYIGFQLSPAQLEHNRMVGR